MKISLYTTAWSVRDKKFDYKGALDNWAVYADEISVAVPKFDDDTATLFKAYADKRGYNVSIVRPDIDFANDPFAYGKTENAAVQNCTGDLFLQANLDERWAGSKARFEELYKFLQQRWDIRAFWIPTVDLYGGHDKYLKISRKWYIHGPGLYRGAAKGGVKVDGRPDYNKTSTDELIDITGSLVPTADVYPNLELETVRSMVAQGWPITYHLGYVDFKDRLDRSLWWKDYWVNATGGDTNTHPTTVAEMAAKEAKPHGLPLWPTRP